MSALSGRRALVTGAGSGIGRAIALALGGAGASLWLVGRREAPLRETAACLGADARVQTADLGRQSDIEALAEALRRESGRLEVLVHAAAELRSGGLADAPLADLERMLAINLQGPAALSRALLDLLREAQGDLVFVNSSVVRGAAADNGAYTASKLALQGLADGLRAELNPLGVRVLSIYPGRTATPLQERLHREQGRLYRPEALLQPEEVASSVLHALSLPRSAEITDLTIRPHLKP